jgi:S1-C subfamily serine protease
MADKGSVLVQFSEALSQLAESARAIVTQIRTAKGRGLSGVLWKQNAVVTSEQFLPDGQDYEVSIGGHVVKAQIAGRDQGTNVAVLKLESEVAQALPAFATAKIGALALISSVGANGLATHLATIRSVGGAWQSLAGATIDQRIVLNAPISSSEEGGPVLAADGSLLGMATCGATGQFLVIPAATIDKAVAALLETGSIERGWLGVALRPVALPDALRPEDSQTVGLMVMDVGADSPAAKAGVLAGDIVLSAGGAPATRFGKIARQLGPNSIGKTIDITLARAGTIVTCEAVIGTRPSG